MVADLQALRDAGARSDALFSLLAESTLYEAGIPLRHPFIFYLGHLPAFARNHLAAVLGVQGQEGPLDTLFERGVDPEQALELQAAEAWPAVDEVLAYRDRARAWVGEAVHAVEGTEHAWVLPMIVEHELMHHETLLYMLNRLPVERLNRPEGWEDPPGGSGGGTERVRVGAGAVQLGADPGTVPFGWDNEFPAEVVEVEAFDLDRYPITVGQWLGFVEAGGYREDRWWSDVDRAWRDAQGVRHPDSWRWHEGQWQVRSLLRWHPLSEVMGWPVHLSLAEARAWCRYRGDCRLPTEPELHRAAFTSPDGSEQPPPTRGAFDFAVRGPIPVGKAGTCSRWGWRS